MADSTSNKPYGFVLPVDVSRLQNERLKLVPMETDLPRFMKNFVEETKDHSELFTYLPYGPFPNVSDYEEWYKGRIGSNDREMLFAVMLKAGGIRKRKPGGSANDFDELTVEDDTYAGVVGLLDALPAHSGVEVGHICIIPRFQRTFVGTHVNGLLLKHLLDPLPEDLQMRRVVWQANEDNQPSVNAAKRIGYQWEGVARWQRVLPENKPGMMEKRQPMEDKEGKKLGPGRNSAMLSFCWDDWLGGGKEKVEKMMTL